MFGLFGDNDKKTQRTEIPQWQQDFYQDQIGRQGELWERANTLAGVGYMPYAGPSVAAFTPTQEAAFQGNIDRARRFGISAPDLNLPEPDYQRGGMSGYSALPHYEFARAAWAARNPGQAQQYNSLFVDPVTGERGAPLGGGQPAASGGGGLEDSVAGYLIDDPRIRNGYEQGLISEDYLDRNGFERVTAADALERSYADNAQFVPSMQFLQSNYGGGGGGFGDSMGPGANFGGSPGDMGDVAGSLGVSDALGDIAGNIGFSGSGAMRGGVAGLAMGGPIGAALGAIAGGLIGGYSSSGSRGGGMGEAPGDPGNVEGRGAGLGEADHGGLY